MQTMKMILQRVNRRYDLNNYKICGKLSSEVFITSIGEFYYEIT